MFSVILFDVDGVILSEERYFDATALTVWELLHSPRYLGLKGEVPFDVEPSETMIRQIRQALFMDDQVLDLMKSRGINSNWDMAYLSFAHQLLCIFEQLPAEDLAPLQAVLQQPISEYSFSTIARLLQGKEVVLDFNRFLCDFEVSLAQKQDLMLYLNDLAQTKLGWTTELFSGTSSLWQYCQETFQEWYLGDQLVTENIFRPPTQEGKKGFLSDEIPIVLPQEMAATFAGIQARGITLGIGTGRPTVETIVPLQAMDLYSYFDRNRLVTASHVLDAERSYPHYAPLSKPHPYTYIQGWLGFGASVEECMKTPLPLEEAQKLLIVGDSVADYLAAEAIGCRFAAVLTGLSGHEAKQQFEELGADYILQDMREVLDILK